MDPVAIGVAFLLGVLTAGAGAVFQAQVLEGRRERALRRALISEIRENVRRLGGAAAVRYPESSIVRSAWDAARALPLEDRVFDLIADAYAAGEELESLKRLNIAHVTSARLVVSRERELEVNAATQQLIAGRALTAHTTFVEALAALGVREQLEPEEDAGEEP